jgi:hypothetical protein
MVISSRELARHEVRKEEHKFRLGAPFHDRVASTWQPHDLLDDMLHAFDLPTEGHSCLQDQMVAFKGRDGWQQVSVERAQLAAGSMMQLAWYGVPFEKVLFVLLHPALVPRTRDSLSTYRLLHATDNVFEFATHAPN